MKHLQFISLILVLILSLSMLIIPNGVRAGAETINCSYDTGISAYNPTLNYKNAAMLSLKSDSAEYQGRALLYFPIAMGATASNVVLKVYCGAYPSYPYGVARITSVWDVNTVTWNSKPAVDKANQVIWYPTVAGWNSINVTAVYNQIINDGTNYGFCIYEASNPGNIDNSLATIESGNTPYLEITPAVDPTWAASFTSTPANTGQVGAAYSYTPTTNESATITAPTLPAWASFAGGTISGTPSEAGTFAFALKATSTAGTLDSYQYWNVTVSAAPSLWAPSFTTTPPDAVELGDTYSYEPACNESVTFSAEDFPAWAGLVDGSIVGLPNEVGAFEFSLRAVSISGTLSSFQNWTVTVEDTTPIPEISGEPAVNATKRVWYQWTPTVDLEHCYWTLNGTAGWLTINQYSGKVSGLPTSAGTFSVIVTALSTEYGTSSTLAYNLTVADVLNPPLDDDDGPSDPGGDGGNDDGVAGISERYLLAGVAVLAFMAIVIVALARRR
jgi:hypothetical protein